MKHEVNTSDPPGIMTISASMNSHTSLVPPILRSKTTILDKSLSRGKQEVSLPAFALLFSETVQYCQVQTQPIWSPVSV